MFKSRFTAVVAALVLGACLGPSQLSAYEIIKTGGFSNGNPCDLPGESSQPHCEVYNVTGLKPNDTFTMHWDYVGPNDTVDVDGVTRVLNISHGTMTIEVELTNNSVSSDGSPASITAFGFTVGTEALEPIFTAFANDGEGAVFDQQAVGDKKDSKLAGIVLDVCVFSVSCSGGSANAGILGGGNSDKFTIDLVASDGEFNQGATLGTFLLKYQGVNSFELPDVPEPVTPEIKVVEPSSVVLFSLGLAGLGFARNRKTA